MTALPPPTTRGCSPVPLSTVSANRSWLGSSSTIRTRQGGSSPSPRGSTCGSGSLAAGASSAAGSSGAGASSHQRRQYWAGGVSARSTGPGTAAEPCRAPPDAFAAAVLEDAGTALLPCRCGDYPHAPASSLLRTAQFDQDRENPSPGSPQPVCGRGARLTSRGQPHPTSTTTNKIGRRGWTETV